MKKLLTLFILCILIPGTLLPDYLIASRSATVKKLPQRNSDIIYRVSPGDTLLLIDSTHTNGYYHVQKLNETVQGWIYKTFVRRYHGTIQTIIGNIASDSSLFYCYAGLPKSLNINSEFITLKNIGYLAGYSENYKTPIWAAYRLFNINNPTTYPRPTRFKVDKRTISRIKHDDYTNTGYDRGHMAPNYAIDTRYGREAQLETFFMSNVCPQKPELNQQTWEALENVEANKYANDFGEMWTITGPIFSSNPSKLTCGVSIPDKFFKIMLIKEDNNISVLGIIMKQTDSGQHPIRDFIATVDSIEALTHLDFFSDLPDSIENAIESTLPDEEWYIDRILK